MTCLHRLVATKAIDYDIQHYLHNECNIIEKLAAVNMSPVDRRLDLILNICRLIVRGLSFEEQESIVKKYSAVLSNNISETDAVLIMNIFIPLRQNVNFTLSPDLLNNVCNLALGNVHYNVRITTCKFIAVVLNKMNEHNECYQRVLLYFKEKIDSSLQSNNIDAKQAAVLLQIWLTKAVIIRGSCDVEIFLNEVCNSFSILFRNKFDLIFNIFINIVSIAYESFQT